MITSVTRKALKKGKEASEKGALAKGSSYFKDGVNAKSVSKAILATGADALTNVGKGFVGTLEGVTDFAQTTLADFMNFEAKRKATIFEQLGDVEKAEDIRNKYQNIRNEMYKNAKTDVTGSIFDSTEAVNATKYLLGDETALTKKDKNWSQELSEKSLAGTLIQSAEQGIGNIGAFAGANVLTGGSAFGTFGTSFASSYGNTFTNDLRNGATEEEARGHAISSGFAEAISEQFFQGIPGVTQAGWADNLVGNSVKKYFGSETGKLALKIFDSAGEGFEEIISNMLEATFEGIRNGKGVDEIWDDVKGQDFFHNEATRDAFWSAIISSALTNGLSNVLSNQQKNQIIDTYAKENNMSTEQVKTLFDNLVEKQASLDEQKNFKDQVELEENIERSLLKDLKENNINLQEVNDNLIARDKFIQAVGTGTVSSEGLDLTESYKAYNGDAKYNNEINNIQKFMNNRNIDARFDATMFDNNEQNAIWTTENGKDSVIFNPNASADQVIQNIATHEMTHDIINQKTEAGTSLFNDVLENIKTQENYAEQRQEIEDLYAKYYDRNSEDFSAKVDEEMVANELGKNLGTQEYINRLVNEKPNLAKRIYNWVVDKLDNIGKSDEYKQQKAYWKSVADKFEVAYNEQKTTTEEDKTAYSMGKHYGDLGKGNDTYYTNMSGSRGTGHFGTGTYFVNEEYQPGETSSYANRPSQKVEFDDYNLFKPATETDGFTLHDGLKAINSKVIFEENMINEFESALNKYNDTLTEESLNDLMNLLEKNDYQVDDIQKLFDEGNSTQAENRLIDRVEDIIDNYDTRIRDYSRMVDVLVNNTDLTRPQIQEAFVKARNKLSEYNKAGYKYGQYPTAKVDSLSTIFMKELGYNGIDVRGLDRLDNTTYGSVIYDLDNKKTTTKYSLTKDNTGRELSEGQREYFKDSKVRDENNDLKVVYHGTANGEFTIFDRSKGNVEGDFGKGFYFSDSLGDVETNYEDGGPDFENKVSRLAERIEQEQDISYDEAEELARKQLYTGGGLFETYLNITNPAIVGETRLFDIDNYTDIEDDLQSEAESYTDEINEYAKDYFGYEDVDEISESDFKEARDEYFREEGIYYDIVDKYVSDDINNAINAVTNELEIWDGDIDKLRGILGESLYDGGIEIQELKDKINSEMEISDNEGNLANNEAVRLIIESLGYDGIIDNTVASKFSNMSMDSDTTHYIAFNPNQIKNVDNLNPTENEDIRYSMQQDVAPFTQGTRTTYGELFDRNIAPIREDISNINEQMNNLSNQLETMQESLENTSKGYVETFKEQRNENIPSKPLTENDANTLQDALMQDEGYIKSLEQDANAPSKNDYLVNRITDTIQQRLDLEKGQRDTLRNIINEAVKNQYTTDEISEALQKEFSQRSYEMTNQESVEARKLIRNTPINVSDGIKTDIADYGDFKRSNFGKITFSRNGLAVDVAYQELSSQMPYFFPSDIVNPTDQLQRIAEVANMATKVTETIDIDSAEFDDIADYINDAILNEQYNNQMQSDYDLEKNIQFDMTGDIAPTTIRTQESINDYIENRDIAPVREERPFTRKENDRRTKIDNMVRQFQEMVTNRNYVIDEVAKATGNNEIKFAGDNLNNVSAESQFNINNKQTDVNGNWIGKGVTEIFEPSKQAGLYEVFNDYLFNKSNIERYAVGKGSQVPLAVSQQLVAQYETQYPEVKKWSKDVYKYYDNVLQEQVDSGLITQEQYDNYRGEHGIYRSYTPFYSDTVDTNRYFDNEGKLKAVTTLKRSKGNASDVNQLLSMEDAMARQTYAYKKAIRQNELYKQIVSSLERFNDAMDMDVRDNPNNLQDSLYTTPEGDKILSAYINGEKVSAKISDELFTELSGDNEARIRQLEEDFSMITKPLQKISNVRRKLLTSWNPTFLARNAIKDIQDAVINSKHTTDMLGNYFGTKKGQQAAIFELNKAKTKEAQQFLALYGTDNTYGDYSSKNGVKSIARLNELIELAPRFAEFKASLQNGESVQQAIYNAREVTTNFGRGGYITKAMNRNGFTFLNANIQGLDKVIRNLTGENGVKGVTSVVVKGAAFAVLPAILNHLMYGLGDDKDEEYEAIPDYIKDNYYLIKTEGGNFVRIPKGRINAVFGSLARRMIEATEGEENALEGWGSNAWSQIGVGDAGGLQTIFTPIKQAINNEAWYGGDIVPTRLQNKPAAEQTDAKIDAISNFIGKTFNISPYKVNYVLDQYSGGIGDVFLPMITPETSSGAEKPHEYLLAPIKDAFVVNSTDDNKYAGEFYDTKDKLQIQSNSQYATDEDKLKYKYMSSISSQMSELYKNKREVQADTTLTKKQKYAQVQVIQNEINNLAKEGLKNYNNFSKTDNYTSIGDTEYYKNDKDEWTKVSDSDAEFTAGLTPTEKTSYYNVKNKIGSITTEYNNKIKGTESDAKKKNYQLNKKEDITRAITNSGLDNYTKAMVYAKYYSNEDTMTNIVNANYNVDTYITAKYDIDEIRNKYSQANGYSTEQRKQKTISYINSLNMNIPQKAMLIREYYSSFRDYNNDIVEYVNGLNIPYEDKLEILKGTGMTVEGNKVTWK